MRSFFWLLAVSLFSLAPLEYSSAQSPNVVLTDPRTLTQTKKKLVLRSANLSSALGALKKQAEEQVQFASRSYYSVTRKQRVPKGVRLTEFFTSNSPRYNKSDRTQLHGFIRALETLAYAWYFLEDPRYARAAVTLSYRFLLHNRTGMEPHLNRASYQTSGRVVPYGVVETAELPRVVDALELISNSRYYTPSFRSAVKGWFLDLLVWLITSRQGREAEYLKNNIAVQYDVQVATYALFTDRAHIAKRVVEAAKHRRVATQIASNGSMPEELSRTRSWDYSTENAKYFARLAMIGTRVGVNLWRYRARSGGGVRRALNFLVPFAQKRRRWSHRQAGAFNRWRLVHALKIAASRRRHRRFRRHLTGTFELSPYDSTRLIYGID